MFCRFTTSTQVYFYARKCNRSSPCVAKWHGSIIIVIIMGLYQSTARHGLWHSTICTTLAFARLVRMNFSFCFPCLYSQNFGTGLMCTRQSPLDLAVCHRRRCTKCNDFFDLYFFFVIYHLKVNWKGTSHSPPLYNMRIKFK